MSIENSFDVWRQRILAVEAFWEILGRRSIIFYPLDSWLYLIANFKNRMSHQMTTWYILFSVHHQRFLWPPCCHLLSAAGQVEGAKNQHWQGWCRLQATQTKHHCRAAWQGHAGGWGFPEPKTENNQWEWAWAGETSQQETDTDTREAGHEAHWT